MRTAQVIDDAGIDIGADDLQVVEPCEAECDQRVDDRPRLIAFRRSRVDEARPRRQVQAGSDDQDAPHAAHGFERLQHVETEGDDVSGLDSSVRAQAA